MLPLAAPLAASGDPIDDKRAEAVRIQNDLDAQGERVSIADEQYNRAQVHLQDVQDSLAKTQSDLQRSNDKIAEIKGTPTIDSPNAYGDREADSKKKIWQPKNPARPKRGRRARRFSPSSRTRSDSKPYGAKTTRKRFAASKGRSISTRAPCQPI